MVLYRAPQQRVMELLRNLALERVCLVVQRWVRGAFARRFRFFFFFFYPPSPNVIFLVISSLSLTPFPSFSKHRDKLIKSRPVIYSALTTCTSLDEASKALEFTETCVGTYSRMFPFRTKEWLECIELRRKLLERKRVTELCQTALKHDPESNFTNLERAVQVCVFFFFFFFFFFSLIVGVSSLGRFGYLRIPRNSGANENFPRHKRFVRPYLQQESLSCGA